MLLSNDFQNRALQVEAATQPVHVLVQNPKEKKLEQSLIQVHMTRFLLSLPGDKGRSRRAHTWRERVLLTHTAARCHKDQETPHSLKEQTQKTGSCWRQHDQTWIHLASCEAKVEPGFEFGLKMIQTQNVSSLKPQIHNLLLPLKNWTHSGSMSLKLSEHTHTHTHRFRCMQLVFFCRMSELTVSLTASTLKHTHSGMMTKCVCPNTHTHTHTADVCV